MQTWARFGARKEVILPSKNDVPGPRRTVLAREKYRRPITRHSPSWTTFQNEEAFPVATTRIVHHARAMINASCA